MLDCGESLRPGEPNIAHMADIKNSDAGANGHVLGDNASADRSRIFNRHIPAVEIDHLCAQRTVSGIKRSLADNGCGFDSGQ